MESVRGHIKQYTYTHSAAKVRFVRVDPRDWMSLAATASTCDNKWAGEQISVLGGRRATSVSTYRHNQTGRVVCVCVFAGWNIKRGTRIVYHLFSGLRWLEGRGVEIEMEAKISVLLFRANGLIAMRPPSVGSGHTSVLMEAAKYTENWRVEWPWHV